MVYAWIAAVLFAGDFFLKAHVEKHVEDQEERELCGGKILVRKYYNKGAALNFMEKSPRILKILCGSILLFLGIIWYILMKKKRNPGVLLGISMILGGGASNLYDRMLKGHVVDYFSFHTPFERLNHIIFNISDLFIFLGCILMVLSSGKK